MKKLLFAALAVAVASTAAHAEFWLLMSKKDQKAHAEKFARDNCPYGMVTLPGDDIEKISLAPAQAIVEIEILKRCKPAPAGARAQTTTKR